MPRLDTARVLVCGDVMLDRYWAGSTTRISPEAPVPVLAVDDESFRPGGAANVALGIAALGAACTLIGLVGDDAEADALEARLIAAGLVCELIRVSDWRTTTKLRVTSRRQQLLRLDFEAPLPAAAGREARIELARRLAERVASHDVLVLSDYDKGALLEPEALLAAAASAAVPVLVDPKAGSAERWRGAAVIKPNLAEFMALTGGAPIADEADLQARGAQLCASAGIGAVLVTRGEAGMTLVAQGSAPIHLPARVLDAFDVTGAGDTVAAVLATAMAAGEDLAQAMELASLAAGAAVARTGTVAVTQAELHALTAGLAADRGVLDRDALRQAVAAAQQRGERVVFTNGCFDLLHAGHLSYLEEARALGDRLVVAVNGDASVTRLKGPGRPINRAEHRARMLAGLSTVDWVTVFDEDTPEALLTDLQPQVLAKGGDYSLDEVVGADLVRAWGGEVRVLTLHPDLSTTAMVERVRER